MAQARKHAEPEVDHNDPRLNHLAMSDGALPLFNAVKKHIAENVAPIEEEFHRLVQTSQELQSLPLLAKVRRWSTM